MNATDDAIGDGWTDGAPSGRERVTALLDAHLGEIDRSGGRLCLDHAIAEDVTRDVFASALAVAPDEVTIGGPMQPPSEALGRPRRERRIAPTPRCVADARTTR